MERPFVARIRERLAATGKSVRRASLDAGLSETALKDLLANETQFPKLDTMEKIANALESDPVSIFFSGHGRQRDEETKPVLSNANRDFTFTPVDGGVQAGVFRTTQAFDDNLGEVISAPRDPDFPFARQIAYRVYGDSMDMAQPKPIRDGDFIICANWQDLNLQLDNADKLNVVVEQTRDGGLLRERSVKEIQVFSDHVKFHPRSSNPAYKPFDVPIDFKADDGREVKILALVRFIFDSQPIGRIRDRR